jgi:MFS family permease
VLDRVSGYLGLLRHPGFRRLWLAQSVSQVGTQVTSLALPLVAILVLDASPFEVALLGAVEFLPFLLFTLPAGVWVDRLPRRRILVVADLGRAVVLAAVPLAAAGHLLAIWQLYVVGFAAGTLTVFFDVAYQAILPELVERDRLQEGNSRLEISRSGAQVLGPGLGGYLVGVLTAPIAIGVDALSYLVSAAFLVGIRRRPTPPLAVGSRGPVVGGSLRREMAEGLRFYARTPLLLASSASVVTQNFAGMIGGSIFLVFIVRELHLAPETIGLAFSIGSLGFLAGAASGSGVGRGLGVGPTLILAAAVAPVAAFLLVIATPETAFWLIVLSAALQGYCVMLVNINAVSLRQALTPDDLQGRVNATGRWINWSVIPVATVLGGALAGMIGLRATLAVGAVVGLAALPWLVFTPIRSLREMPRPFAQDPVPAE